MSKIIECCGCGRFRTASSHSNPSLFSSCVECEREGAQGRVWDDTKRTYVTLESGHDYVDGFDDNTHDQGRRSDAEGRL